MVFGIQLIRTANTGIRETFGRFTGTAKPGLNFYVPFIQRIVPISNRLSQNTFNFEVKTKDNVFANLKIAVQYKIMEEDSEKAFYSMNDPIEQVDAYIENVVRSQVPKMNLDELFESQDYICKSVSEQLSKGMQQYGYTIQNTLVTGIEPDKNVKEAMNHINASKRLMEAAKNEADAEYIKRVREAEADRDRKRLQGEGISMQRLAIISGYKEGIETMSNDLSLSAKDIIQFVMQTQRLDTLEAIGRSNNAKTLFLEHNTNDLRKSVLEANESQNFLD